MSTLPESSINEENGILVVKIPFKGGNLMDQEVNGYGVLAKAEKMLFQYFAMEYLKEQKNKMAGQLIKPTFQPEVVLPDLKPAG